MTSKAIVFGITADHAFAAGTALASLLAHDPAFDSDVVIYHDGLPDNQQAAFMRLWPRCRFRPFGADAVSERLGVPLDDPRVAPYFAHLSPMVLAKLELPDLLDDYSQVVWLDDDVLVRSKVQDLWDFDCLAWRPLPQGAFSRRQGVLDLYANQSLDPNVPLLNGGVIGVARGFATRGGSRRIIHEIARHLIAAGPSTQLAEMPWYLVAATLGLPVKAWPMRLNHPVTTPGVTEASIAHAIGPHKFWNATPLRHLFPDWLHHQATWVANGGAAYSGPLLLCETHPAEASEVLRAADNREYWLKVHADLRPKLPPGILVDLRHDQKSLRLYLHGRPEGEHLALIRLANARRLGLEMTLPPDQAGLAVTAVQQAVAKTRVEKGQFLSLPLGQVADALSAVLRAVSQD